MSLFLKFTFSANEFLNKQRSIYFSFLLITLSLGIGIGVNAQGFTEVSSSAGIDHLFQVGDAHFGGGAAVIDYNNDGYEDLFLPGGTGPDRFYHNNGDGTFSDILSSTGLSSADPYHCMGASAADLNNDGFKDLLLLTRSFDADINRYAHNLLYLNNGDGTFSDITVSAGFSADSAFSHAATFGDVDMDGDLDIYIANFFKQPFYDFADSSGVFDMMSPVFLGKRNFFYLNNGDLTFTEAGALYGIADSGAAWPVTFTDFDNDGDVDLSVGNDFGWDLVPSALFRNDYPAPVFSDISSPSGMDVDRTAMGVAIGDYDEDGMLEYYYTMTEYNEMMDNNGEGEFLNVAGNVGVRNDSFIYERTEHYLLYTPTPGFSGTDSTLVIACDSTFGTCDTFKIYLEVVPSGMARPDSVSNGENYVWVVEDSLEYIFSQKRDINGFFAQIDTLWGVSSGVLTLGDSLLVSEENTVGWGCMFLDYDQDTWLDLFVANGSLSPMGVEWPQENPNALFHNNGDGTFTDVSDSLGMNSYFKSRGTVRFDYDLDGDLDILIVNQNWPDRYGEGVVPHTLLMRNDASGSNHWLKIQLTGTTHNRDAKGARVHISVDGRTLIQEVDGGSSIHSNHTPIVHFGLGSYTKVDTLVVTWPDQCRQIFLDVSANQMFDVVEGDLKVTIPDTVDLCFGDTLTLGVMASPEYDFYWTHSGETTPYSLSTPTTEGRFELQISDGATCMYPVPFEIDLSPDTMGIGGLEPYYCVLDPAAVPLSLLPSTGVLTGPGVAGMTFSPALADTGWHTLTLEYTDTTGCLGKLERSVWVYDSPAPILDFDTSVCAYTDPFPLAYLPSEGSLTGPGASGGMFYPDSAVAGANVLTFNYSDPDGCSSTLPVTVHVTHDPGTEILLSDTTYCSHNPPVSLSATPGGGVFSGPQVVGSTFTPSLSILGSNTLWYEYTDSVGCIWADSHHITILESPEISISGISSPYFTTDPVDTLIGIPPGGFFDGAGVTGNLLDPAVAGPGSFLLNYFYVDPITGCKKDIDSVYVVNLVTGMQDLDENSVIVFPNPFSDHVNIEVPTTVQEPLEVRISDISGALVYSSTIPTDNRLPAYQISTKGFTSGVYLVEIRTEKSIVERVKMVKK